MNNIPYFNYSNYDVCKDAKPSIFLAGPTYRGNYDKSWRRDAEFILQKHGFDGIVYIPEYEKGLTFDGKTMLEKQTFWERDALARADVIVFWIPRKMDILPGMTTNVEFGRYITLKPSQVVLGHPNDAEQMRYIDLLYRECGNGSRSVIFSTLEETLSCAIELANKIHSNPY